MTKHLPITIYFDIIGIWETDCTVNRYTVGFLTQYNPCLIQTVNEFIAQQIPLIVKHFKLSVKYKPIDWIITKPSSPVHVTVTINGNGFLSCYEHNTEMEIKFNPEFYKVESDEDTEEITYDEAIKKIDDTNP